MLAEERVFEEGFVPSDVVHRHDEVNQLSSALQPLVEGGRAEHAFLFGPTGAGKTCVARYTLRELQAAAAVDVGYVDCWSDYTRFRVLERALSGVDAAADVHRQSTPTDELLDRLRRVTDRPYVLVLDEADQLGEAAVLHDLYRVPEVTLVCIANRERDLFTGLDDRLTSRLTTGTRVRFDSYGGDELVAILKKRVERGLDGDVAERHLRAIADAAAGDARVAIGTLRHAARRVAAADVDRLTDEIVAAAVPAAETQVRRRTLDRLTDHQRVLYETVRDAGEIEPGALYERYEAQVAEPKARRTLRNYLAKMERYNLVVSDGEKGGRTYRHVE